MANDMNVGVPVVPEQKTSLDRFLDAVSTLPQAQGKSKDSILKSVQDHINTDDPIKKMRFISAMSQLPQAKGKSSEAIESSIKSVLANVPDLAGRAAPYVNAQAAGKIPEAVAPDVFPTDITKLQPATSAPTQTTLAGSAQAAPAIAATTATPEAQRITLASPGATVPLPKNAPARALGVTSRPPTDQEKIDAAAPTAGLNLPTAKILYKGGAQEALKIPEAFGNIINAALQDASERVASFEMLGGHMGTKKEHLSIIKPEETTDVPAYIPGSTFGRIAEKVSDKLRAAGENVLKTNKENAEEYKFTPEEAATIKKSGIVFGAAQAAVNVAPFIAEMIATKGLGATAANAAVKTYVKKFGIDGIKILTPAVKKAVTQAGRDWMGSVVTGTAVMGTTGAADTPDNIWKGMVNGAIQGATLMAIPGLGAAGAGKVIKASKIENRFLDHLIRRSAQAASMEGYSVASGQPATSPQTLGNTIIAAVMPVHDMNQQRMAEFQDKMVDFYTKLKDGEWVYSPKDPTKRLFVRKGFNDQGQPTVDFLDEKGNVQSVNASTGNIVDGKLDVAPKGAKQIPAPDEAKSPEQTEPSPKAATPPPEQRPPAPPPLGAPPPPVPPPQQKRRDRVEGQTSALDINTEMPSIEELRAQKAAKSAGAPEVPPAPEASKEAPPSKAAEAITPEQPRGVKEQAPSPEGTVSGEQKAGEQATPPASTVPHETPASRAKVSDAIKNPDMPLDGFTDAQKEIIQKYREKRAPKTAKPEPEGTDEEKLSKTAKIIQDRMNKGVSEDREKTSDESAQKLAINLNEAIKSKNFYRLRDKLWLHNKGSRAGFEHLTGLKLPATQHGTEKVIRDFVGEEAYAQQKKAVDEKQAGEKSASDQKERQRLIDRDTEHTVNVAGELKTMKQHIEDVVKAGYNVLDKEMKGPIPQWRLRNPEKNRSSHAEKEGAGRAREGHDCQARRRSS